MIGKMIGSYPDPLEWIKLVKIYMYSNQIYKPSKGRKEKNNCIEKK
jgi:hypothetical protein